MIGVVINNDGCVISFLSQRQCLVDISMKEAEIIAANDFVKQIIWFKQNTYRAENLTQGRLVAIELQILWPNLWLGLIYKFYITLSSF